MKKTLLFSLIMAVVTVPAFCAQYNVLVIVGDSHVDAEAQYLQTLNNVEGISFSYEVVHINSDLGNRGTKDAVNFGKEIEKGNIKLSDYQIIWFTWNGPGHDGGYFMEGAEDAVKEFVKNGGVVWMGAFDNNFNDPDGNQVGGWFPIDEHPVTIMDTGDAPVKITSDGDSSGLFSKPNKVDMNAITLDDNFANVDKDFVILATRTDNNQPAAFVLHYGKGAYVEVCYDTRDAGKLEAAKPLLENGLYYCATLVKSAAVDPGSKLPITWGEIKCYIHRKYERYLNNTP